MTKIILLLTLALSGLALSQSSSGLGSKRNKTDSNKGNALTAEAKVNWYIYGKVLEVLPNGLLIKTSSKTSVILMHYPKKLKAGQPASAWVRKAPKKIDAGNHGKLTLYGFLQYRDNETKITKRNQKRAF